MWHYGFGCPAFFSSSDTFFTFTNTEKRSLFSVVIHLIKIILWKEFFQ